ncbi:NAD(P)/FAD-dependent oxidoreductase [Caldithrix abyssi]
MQPSEPIHIIGAGPAGLTAAINLVKAGFKAIVHEKNDDVGNRFNGDFQGIENWSSDEDARSFLKNHGLEINFLCAPYGNGEFFGPNLKGIKIKTNEPLFYLIERGTGEQSFDQGLKRQALEAGVQFIWKDNVVKLPARQTIVSTGPKAADIIAQGILFKTSHSDGYFGFVDDRIAPKGYAYLLVNQGRATFATCLFEDFRNSQRYFDRALTRMQKVVDIEMQEIIPFGGFGNFFLPPITAGQNRNAIYVGESAGFQDALWGFGIRFAVLSGYLAAESIIKRENYDYLINHQLLPLLKITLANRLLYDQARNFGRQRLLNRIQKSTDVVNLLRKQHRLSFFKKLLFLLAKRWYHTRLINKNCLHENCNCIWCRCSAKEQPLLNFTATTIHHLKEDGS